jgi:hypothetical protein
LASLTKADEIDQKLILEEETPFSFSWMKADETDRRLASTEEGC